MKKYNLFLVLCICALAFFSTNEVWAKGEKTFYAKLKTQVGNGCTNMGKVYAGDSNTAGTYNATSSTSGELNSGEQSSETEQYSVGPFYAFAQANSGYKFVGWKETDSDAAEIISTANPYPTNITATSITSGSGTTKTLYAFFQEQKSVNITFIGTNSGSYKYTINATTTTISGSNQTANDVEIVTLSTPTPANGYAFAGWYQINTDGSLTDLSGSSSFTVDFSESGNIQIGARFVSTSSPQFVIKETSTTYYGLKAASLAASPGQTIVPIADCTINGSDLMSADNNTYTIPVGVTLLVPYDTGYTLKTSEPNHSNTNKGAASLFRKLTLSGVKLNVNGSICVGGEQIFSAGGGAMSGYTNGKYGQLVIEENSIVNLNGANLYAWGFVTGGGQIYAFSGSNVYEPLQLDFRGGSYCSDNYKKVFVANQYYVQNIETPITFYSGSKEIVFTGIFINSGSIEVAKAAPFIASDGLFKLNSGASLTKRYDPINDRQIYDIDGDAQLQGIELELYSGLFITVILDSKIVVLPLTNNMIINIHSGTTNIMYDSEMLADAKIVIDEGATLKAKSNLYVYDKTDYVGKTIGLNGDINSVPYSPTKTGSRTSDKIADAKLEINGTLEMYVDGSDKGYLYTTPNGADICSSGSGLIKLASGAGTLTSFKENKGTSSPQDISIVPAQLHNSSEFYSQYTSTSYGNFEYLPTSGAKANTTIQYANHHWGWVGIWKNYDGTILKVANVMLESQLAAQAPNDPTKAGDDCYDYSFSGWTQERNATNQEIVYTATYTHTTKTYTITYMAGENGAGSIEAGTKTCGEDFTLSSNTFVRGNYIQTGWSTTDGGAKVYELGGTYTANEDITLYPYWEEKEVVGSLLDIVDWSGNGDGQSLTLNMNGYSSDLATNKTGWKIKIGGIEKNIINRESDRTLIFDGLTLSAGQYISIEGYNANDEIETVHDYLIPQVITGSTTITSANSQYIYVRSGSLTINGDISVAKVVVCAGAELIINSGKTLTVTDRLVLRTRAFESAVLTNNGTLNVTGQMYYSRIAGDKSQTFEIGFPFDVNLNNVKFSHGGAAAQNSNFGLFEYNSAQRAQNGVNTTSSNWELVNATTMNGQKGYQLMSTSAYYQEYLFPVTYSKPNGNLSVAIAAYPSNSKQDQGWNYIVSPYTHKYIVSTQEPSEAVKICELVEDNTTFWQHAPEVIMPARPFYYQAQTAGTLSFGDYFSFSSSASSAPGRAAKSNSLPTQWIQLLYGSESDITPDNISAMDETNIYVNTDKFTTEYETGYDVVKMSKSGRRPLLWSSVSCGDLAFAALPDEALEAGIPLTVSAPEDGIMVFMLKDNRYMGRIEQLILYDAVEDRYIDLLYRDYSYVAKKGVTAGRFVLSAAMNKAPETTTSVDNTEQNTLVAWTSGKQIFAERPAGGAAVRCYDAVGQLVGTDRSGAELVEFNVPTAGVYILKSEEQVTRVVVR